MEQHTQDIVQNSIQGVFYALAYFHFQKFRNKA